jgi:hypothetical protein
MRKIPSLLDGFVNYDTVYATSCVSVKEVSQFDPSSCFKFGIGEVAANVATGLRHCLCEDRSVILIVLCA